MSTGVNQAIRITRKQDRLQIEPLYNPDFVYEMQILGGRWRYRTGIWSLPITTFPKVQEVCLKIWGISILNIDGSKLYPIKKGLV